MFEGEVIQTVYLGNVLDCRVRVGGHELSVQIDHFEQIAPQQKVYLSFAPDHGLCLAEIVCYTRVGESVVRLSKNFLYLHWIPLCAEMRDAVRTGTATSSPPARRRPAACGR